MGMGSGKPDHAIKWLATSPLIHGNNAPNSFIAIHRCFSSCQLAYGVFFSPLSSLLALTDRVCARRGFERNPRMVWSDVGSTSSPIGFPKVGVPSLRGRKGRNRRENFSKRVHVLRTNSPLVRWVVGRKDTAAWSGC